MLLRQNIFKNSRRPYLAHCSRIHLIFKTQVSIHSHSVLVPEPVEWADSNIHLMFKTQVSIHSHSVCHSHS